MVATGLPLGHLSGSATFGRTLRGSPHLWPPVAWTPRQDFTGQKATKLGEVA